MKERFDSWKGFLDAGFEPAEDGALCLGDEVASYSVTKMSGGLRVKFTGAVPGYEEVAFSLLFEFDDMYGWAARIAYGTFGARENWDRLRAALSGRMNSDLEQLISIGTDHLDEIDVGTDDEPRPEEGNVAAGGDWPNRLREVVKTALDAAWRKLFDAVQAQDMEQAQGVIDRMSRLRALNEKIAALANEWRELGLDTPTVPNPVPTEPPVSDPPVPEPPKPEPPKPVPPGPMGFAVTFEDGVRIAEAKASVTFAKVIEKIGAERVAALGLKMAGDPIVTKDRGEIKKMPMVVLPIADGWFVKTHSNTYTKMEFLRRISQALNVRLKFETFHREPIGKSLENRGRGRPTKHSKTTGAFQIGRAVKWAFPKVFEKGNVTEEEIALFLSDKSKRKFGTRGYPVLKELIGNGDDCIVNGHRRYYADVRLEHAGHIYLLTSQFLTANAEPILAWLETKGFSRGEMERIGRNATPVPSLFDEPDLFSNVVNREHPRGGPKSGTAEPTSFSLTSDALQPTLFDAVVTKRRDAESAESDTGLTTISGEVPAADVKMSLRSMMKRRRVTPSSLASELHLPCRLVKSWYKGRGVICAAHYKTLCSYLEIDNLKPSH